MGTGGSHGDRVVTQTILATPQQPAPGFWMQAPRCSLAFLCDLNKGPARIQTSRDCRNVSPECSDLQRDAKVAPLLAWLAKVPSSPPVSVDSGGR